MASMLTSSSFKSRHETCNISLCLLASLLRVVRADGHFVQERVQKSSIMFRPDLKFLNVQVSFVSMRVTINSSASLQPC